jgi:hypothetical protein
MLDHLRNFRTTAHKPRTAMGLIDYFIFQQVTEGDLTVNARNTGRPAESVRKSDEHMIAS